MSQPRRTLTRLSPALAVAATLLVAACGASSVPLSPAGAAGAAGASGAAGAVGVDASGNASVLASDGSGVAAAGDGDASVSASAAGSTDGDPSDAASPGTDADTSAGGGASFDGTTVVLPDFPVIRVPDISSVTKKATATQAAIAKSVPLPAGVEVTGARCDAKGAIVNRSGISVGGADDGSAVVARGGVSQVGKNGAGSLVGGDVVYDVAANGSGQAVAGDVVLEVNADGSGQYVDGGIVYEVHADGSGSVVTDDATGAYTVNADGSGSWVGTLGPVENAGDGTGTWTGPIGVVTVAGDGTGTLNGAPVKVAPMAKFALLGKLPKLKGLGPVGKPCGTLIRISAGVLFDFDKATIRPEAKPVLAAVAKALATSTKAVQVNGHTDAKGDDAYNLDLSKRRAQAVVAELTADGLSTPTVAKGFGESQPVAPNTLKGKDNPAGRQLNRRVEIVIPG